MLIDAGFGIRSLRRRFKEAGLEFSDIDAIVLTHGHSDHVNGVEGLLKKTSAVVYMNEGTREEVPALGKVDPWERIECGREFSIGDISFEAFDIPHDSAEPVGFRVSCEGIEGVLATDLGELAPDVGRRFQSADWIVLESNHDEDLLRLGPYPWSLKRRVLGAKGHLSNRALAEFLSNEFDGSARHIFLAHLSQQNNDPELAFETASLALSERLPLYGNSNVHIHLTHQNNPSIVVSI